MRKAHEIPSGYSDTCSAGLNGLNEKRSTGLNGSARSPFWFSRVPADIGLDTGLSDAAARAYMIMALYVGKTSRTSVGMRRLGKLMKRSGPSAANWISELESRGYLKRKQGANGRRNTYEFTSPVFSAGRDLPGMLPKSTDVPMSDSTGRPKTLRAAVACARCHVICRKVAKHGWCRGCAVSVDLEARVATARLELGNDATPEQLAAHLKNARLAAKIRRLIRRTAA